MHGLIAAIATRQQRVAELVLGQTFSAAALERVFRALTPRVLRRVAVELVLPVRTLLLAVANAGPRDAPATLRAFEGLLGTLGSILGVGAKRALLVRAIAAVRPSVAHKEPADAYSAGSALEGPLRAARVVRRATPWHVHVIRLGTVTPAAIADAVGVRHLALSVQFAL